MKWREMKRGVLEREKQLIAIKWGNEELRPRLGEGHQY